MASKRISFVCQRCRRAAALWIRHDRWLLTTDWRCLCGNRFEIVAGRAKLVAAPYDADAAHGKGSGDA